MTRKKKNGDQPIGVGLTAKQMKRKKPINTDMLRDVEALTDNQKALFASYGKDKNIVAYGAAGTGKTFITLYKALGDVLNTSTPYDKIYIVRSLVATREIGFLPGDHEDKSYLYQIPYKNMVKYMFEMPSEADFEMLYGNLKAQETIGFWSTSFIRGTTLDRAIVISGKPNLVCSLAEARLWADEVREAKTGVLWSIDGIDPAGALRLRNGSSMTTWSRWD